MKKFIKIINFIRLALIPIIGATIGLTILYFHNQGNSIVDLNS